MYTSQMESSAKRGHANPTYSRKWFKSWLFSNPEFHRLYDIWVLNRYEKSLIPSVDRLDDYLGYTEYNIRLTTWGENNKKGNYDRRNGINNKVNNAVMQFTKELEFVTEHHSVREAERVTGISNANICKVCVGKRKSAGGYIWKYRNTKDI